MRYLLFVLIIMPFLLSAQLTESFDDGDFTNSPTWTGDVSSFEVLDPPTTGDGSLNASAGDDGLVLRSIPNIGDAVLVVPSTYAYGEWRFSVADAQDWSVSSTNDYKIILMSDNATVANLTDGAHNFNGYFIQLDGGNDDQFTLYRQSGGTSTIIIDTDFPASTDGSTAVGRTIKVLRSDLGDWSVFIDEGFGIDPTTQHGPTVNDNTHTTSSYFGIATNIANPGNQRLIYFDELYIGEATEDTIKPTVEQVQVMSDTELDIHFSETVEQTTAESLTNYLVNNSIGNPLSATRDATDNSLVHLTFGTAFTLGLENTITIQNVEDLNSNVVETTDVDFMYFVVSEYDVVVNEIMADPNPAVALPLFEYVELYNTTGADIDLTNWTITVGTSTKTITGGTLESGGYVILCHVDAEAELETYGDVITVSSFPALTNAGSTILIEDNTGLLIDSVTYSDTWYQDSEKDDGGWSLERIDPANICSGMNNWIASNHTSGGTPGSINSVNAPNLDTESPQVLNVFVVTDQQLRVEFSEVVSQADAENTANYSVSNSIGAPNMVTLDTDTYATATLSFTSSFTSETNYELTVTNINDECSNMLTTEIITFQYFVPSTYDVLITEVMADPEPVVNLPASEYIEIHNSTAYDIDLIGWTLQAGSTSKSLPDIKLDAGAYHVICDDGDTELITSVDNITGISSFPSLTNSGMDLILYDQNGLIVHTVSYSEDWYNDAFKDEGGWSLEMIDPQNPCEGSNNWSASNDSEGGTPGEINSVHAENPDIYFPELVRFVPYDEYTLQFFFSESLDSTTFQTLTNYILDNDASNTVSIDPVEPDYSSVYIVFDELLNTGLIHTIEIIDTIFDCVGNEMILSEQFSFSWPLEPDANDIIINEVLFDPLENGADYVELYNRSEKYFNVKDLSLATRDDGELESIKEITADGFLLGPGEYLLITTNVEVVMEHYVTNNAKAFVETESMPTYSNESGTVVLLDKYGSIVDEFSYTDEMHFDLLSSVDGVSLERIDFDRPTDDATNWHSAAQTVGFGTPGYENSQYSSGTVEDDPVSVSPEVFSPDNDGYEDVLNINYQFTESGYVADVSIYDARGRLVAELLKNDLLAVEGTVTWDGIDRFNQKARVGAYIVLFKVFDLNGNVKKYKLPCVVATKFE